jgi:hypothetical protein
MPQVAGTTETQVCGFRFVRVTSGWSARRANCQGPGIAFVDLAMVLANPNRRKVAFDGGEDRGAELGASHIVDLWPLVLLIAFGPEHLE